MTQGLFMSEIIFHVESAPEGGYTAKALGFSIFTEGDTWIELKTNIKDAVACHFEPSEAPSVIRLHRVEEELMAA
jgi:hypothetical protein